MSDTEKLEGPVVLLLHTITNCGTLNAQFLEDVSTVDWAETRPLAYFLPRKAIPKFKFRSISTSRVEMTRNADGRKKYNGWVEFLKRAQDFNGSVVLLRGGDINDPQGFVKVLLHDSHDNVTLFHGAAPVPVKDEYSGVLRQLKCPEGSKIDPVWPEIAATAVVAGDAYQFDGVKTMVSTHFVTNTNLIGACFRAHVSNSMMAANAQKAASQKQSGVSVIKSHLRHVNKAADGAEFGNGIVSDRGSMMFEKRQSMHVEAIKEDDALSSTSTADSAASAGGRKFALAF